MPYLVLAFGLVMSVIGVISIVFGYPIIQVERGWASVIAGATLLAGGAVTAALGLVLKAVTDLGRTTPSQDIAISTSQPMATPMVDFGGLELPVAKPPATTPPETTPHVVQTKTTAPPVADLPTTAFEPPIPERSAPEALVLIPEALVLVDAADEPPALAYEDPIEPAPEPEPVPVPVPAPDADATLPPPAPVPPPAKAEPALSMDDWLEQSFAEFDRENADLIATAPPEPDLSPALPEPPVLPEPETVIPVAEPEPAAVSPALPEQTSAVIGRYEADGTSYVMYADGSIDASSAVGVYRFGSMAELKTYIEG